MKLATWNVNSIRARLPRVLDWLDAESPDVVCLQETKVADDEFPVEALREHGWEAAFHGQPTYNGVAILTREPVVDVTWGLGDGDAEEQARLIAGTAGGVRVVSTYVPNGAYVGSTKWTYKLAWLERLGAWLGRTCDPARPVIVCGDLNVARDDKDVARPEKWGDTVLFHPEARKALEDLMGWGLEDVFRRLNPEGGIYSWWDYRRLAFPKNDGLRIDHILATPALAGCCSAAWVDREARKGEKPSDHAPVLAVFD